MHVIPPTTDTFTITYKKENSRLVSGLSLDINVQFRPTEWRYYYDCIRIHCKVSVYIHMSYVHVYIHTHIHTCTYIHTYIHTCIHTYIHAYIHAYIHTYVHTY